MYNDNDTNKKHKLSTSYLARPNLGVLKNLYNNYNTKNTTMKPLNNINLDKKKKTRKTNSTKMDTRKRPDYADTAYREAVSRLRILLAESYTPIRHPLHNDLDSAGEETDNQSVVSGISRKSRLYQVPHTIHTHPHNYYNTSYNITPRRLPVFAPTRSTNFNGATTSDPLDKNFPELPTTKIEANNPPPELMSFIEKQEDYIEQLEKESRFCRGELSTLLGKVKDVITENEHLHDKQKTNIIKSVFDHLDTETETETDMDNNGKLLTKSRPMKKRFLEGPSIVFESRISELEAQLTQTKIDLKKAQDEADEYRRKMADGTLADGLGFDSYRKQIETLQREKNLAQENVVKLQSTLNQMRDKEYTTSDQMKRSLDVAEQAQYEKSAAEIEIRRLKDELERQHGKLREAISDQSRRVVEERNTVERRFTQQIEQLQNDLAVQWESNSKLQLELDKQRRENTEMRRELSQKQALVDDIRKDMQNKISALQSDIGVSAAEKCALEQQISTLQMMNERNDRQNKQEVARLHVEMQSLRQRLDRADADLIHSRRENVRLNDEIASLEKQINLNAALNEEKNKRNEPMALPSPKEDKEKELSSLVQEMESKHAATVAELEGMIHSQNQLMDKLSNECHALTQKLEDASTRHKEEIRELQNNLDHLSSRMNQTQLRSTNRQANDERNNVSPIAPKKDITEHKILTAPKQASLQDETASNLNTNNVVEQKSKIPNEPHQPTAEESQSKPIEKEQEKTEPYTQENYPQDYYNEQYQYDPNTQYDPSQYNEMYDTQQYDPNQQYMTQEEYEQQYGAYDPNAQYAEEDQQYDPNQNTNNGQNVESTENNKPQEEAEDTTTKEENLQQQQKPDIKELPKQKLKTQD